MKKIDTLIEDINALLENGVLNEDYEDYGRVSAEVLSSRLDPVGSTRAPKLRLSSIGTPCARKLWYEFYATDEREPLHPNAKLKFLYGDVVETLVLELARKAGHLVQGEQDVISVYGVEGHRDCVIDGMLVDVKSASDYSFRKFEGGLQREDDGFGYLTQLGSYLLGSRQDPLVVEKNKAAFFVINKVTGNLCLDVHEFTEEDFDAIKDTIEYRKNVVGKTSEAPERAFKEVPEGKSGNLKLGVNCSYCQFKTYCWPELRTFMYAGNRPVFLTKVEREPNVLEVTKE